MEGHQYQKKLNEAVFSKEFVYSAEIPKKFDKYAIYSHFGTTDAVDPICMID